MEKISALIDKLQELKNSDAGLQTISYYTQLLQAEILHQRNLQKQGEIKGNGHVAVILPAHTLVPVTLPQQEKAPAKTRVQEPAATLFDQPLQAEETAGRGNHLYADPKPSHASDHTYTSRQQPAADQAPGSQQQAGNGYQSPVNAEQPHARYQPDHQNTSQSSAKDDQPNTGQQHTSQPSANSDQPNTEHPHARYQPGHPNTSQPSAKHDQSNTGQQEHTHISQSSAKGEHPNLGQQPYTPPSSAKGDHQHQSTHPPSKEPTGIRKELNELVAKNTPSLNDALRSNGKVELGERLGGMGVKDLKDAIGINDKFQFIQELFRSDKTMYDRCIKTINESTSLQEAENWIERELKIKLGWDEQDPLVKQFYSLVRKRFS